MIIRALWLRPTLAHPIRALVTMLGVAIGVASVVSTLLASRAAVASMGRDVETIAGKARLEITRPGGVEETALRALRPICGEALLVPVVEGTGLSLELGDIVRLLGVDLLIDADVRELTLRGDDSQVQVTTEELQDIRDSMLIGDGVALTSWLADQLKLKVGDDLVLIVRSREVTLRVAALVEPERFDSAWERVVLMDIALAQEVMGRIGRFDRVELMPRLALDSDVLAARALALLPPGYRVEPSVVRREEGERMTRALEFNLTALAGVSILVGIVLVATTLATSIVQRRTLIALLRSLGASRQQLACAILVEAGVIGLVGGIAGVLLGWAGAQGAIAGVSATVASMAEGVIPGEVKLSLGWAFVGVMMGLGASIVAALLPLREALQTPPLQGLRAEHAESATLQTWKARSVALLTLLGAAYFFAQLPPIDDRPVWALLSALCVLATLLVLAGPLVDLSANLRLGLMNTGAGVSLRLAQAGLKAGRSRAAWAAGAVGMAVGLAVAMTTMVSSFRESVVTWTQEAMPSDLFIRPMKTNSGALAGRLDPEVVSIVDGVLGHENVDPFHQSKAYFRDQAILMGGAAFGVVSREGGVPFLDGRPAQEVFLEALRVGGVVINEPFSRRFDVVQGETVTLDTPRGPVSREVVGVYRDYSGHIGRAVLNLADFLSLYPDEGPHSISAFVASGGDVELAREAVNAALQGRFAVEVLNNREVRAEILKVFERTFAVTIALQIISSMVAGIAVIAVLTALIHERRRDLAVVRVLGGSRRQLFGLVLFEAFLLGLAGTVGGLLVGLVVGYVLVTVVNLQSFGWTLQFIIPASLYITILAVMPACLLAGIFPAILATRHAPRESLNASR
ncbi:MAG: putative ABC transport system permease protein [Planctomycetota bacterium]|jgi:putative ABC transport system permease protein